MKRVRQVGYGYINPETAKELDLLHIWKRHSESVSNTYRHRHWTDKTETTICHKTKDTENVDKWHWKNCRKWHRQTPILRAASDTNGPRKPRIDPEHRRPPEVAQTLLATRENRWVWLWCYDTDGGRPSGNGDRSTTQILPSEISELLRITPYYRDLLHWHTGNV